MRDLLAREERIGGDSAQISPTHWLGNFPRGEDCGNFGRSGVEEGVGDGSDEDGVNGRRADGSALRTIGRSSGRGVAVVRPGGRPPVAPGSVREFPRGLGFGSLGLIVWPSGAAADRAGRGVAAAAAAAAVTAAIESSARSHAYGPSVHRLSQSLVPVEQDEAERIGAREKVDIERASYTTKRPRARNRDSAVDGGKTFCIAL